MIIGVDNQTTDQQTTVLYVDRTRDQTVRYE